MDINNKRYSIIIWGAIIIILLWEAHIFSVFHALNGFAYDHFMRFYLKSSTSEQLIVLDGEQNYAEKGDEAWFPVLKNLLAQDVKQVVFNFSPEKVSAEFYQFAANSGKVIFSQHVLSAEPYSAVKLRPLPESAKGKNIALGGIMPPSSQDGVYRTQNVNLQIAGQTINSLEFLVAERGLAKKINANSSDYLINFTGGSARIPKINLAQALSASLVKELFAGRTVLIGIYGTEPLPSYFTPLSSDSKQTTEVMYHAFALDTLLSERTIHSLPNWLILLGMAGISFVTLVFCHYLTLQQALITALALSFGYGLLSWFCLQYLFLWIPPIEFVIAQWLIVALVWRKRSVQEQQLLNDMQLSLSTNLQDKSFPVSFYQSDDPWTQLIAMINQSLNLTRILFLERVPNDHRLKEIKAFNCRINDVIELRRDYERTPYSTAIQENRPSLLVKPYLRELAVKDLQFLAPLIFADEILGFWAFSVEPQTFMNAKTKFMALTHAYMMQISEFLYYRQEWLKQQKQQEQSHWLKALQFNSVTQSYGVLNQSIALLERRASELQNVFNTLNTGGVLYDLFGRVLLANRHMENLAQSANIKIYNMTPLEIIVALTGLQTDQARQFLQKTIFDLEANSIPVPQLMADHDFLLHIQPLTVQDSQEHLSNSTATPQVVGILIELEDVTYLKTIYGLKEQVFERVSYKLQQELTNIQSELIAIDKADDSLNQYVTSSIDTAQHKVGHLLTILDSVNNDMQTAVENAVFDLGRYPIDGLPIIKDVIAELNDHAISRMILVHLEAPAVLGLTFAAPRELQQVFKALLSSMIDDTFDGEHLSITVEDNAEWVHYGFRNVGIGISYKQPQADEQNETEQPTDSTTLAQVYSYVKRWGGKLEISSQIGKGSSISLSLKRFF